VPDFGAVARADQVHQLFLQNRDADALAAAREVLGRRDAPVVALYAGGLAAWRLQRWDDARALFEAAAASPTTTPALAAAAAFWAARANLATRNPQGYAPLMTRAAAEPRTLHGLLARRILGQTPRFAWYRERLAEADTALLLEQPGARRALALIQVSQAARAEAELRAVWPTLAGRPMAQRAVLLTAAAAGMNDLAAQFATLLHAADGSARDHLRFPVPRLMPRDGYRVDPTLIYALARLESNFNARAVSPAGARGLMQLMPMTASYIAGDPSLAGANRERLHDPELNLEIGQRYIWYLANHAAIGGDLIRLLAAYNVGPGSVLRWGPQIRHADDPLLYIEAIPVTETRRFVGRALAYSWIYAARLGLPSTSLDELAAGQWPRFRQPQVVLGRRS
jgi:soluble lytic murein transglycosylase-like protein